MEESMSNSAPPVMRAASPKSFFKRFLTIMKMASIAILILLLLIPLYMVKSVLEERLERHDSSVREITSTWGKEQVIIGPFLIIPFKDKTLNFADGSGSLVRHAYFLPEKFTADGRIDPQRLHRGIYEAVVYSGKLDLTGAFIRPTFEEWKLDPQQILWDEAEIALSITDLRGTKESLQIKLGEQTIPLNPGGRLEGFEGGAYARVKGLKEMGETIPFAISLTFNGSRSLRFAPTGVNNEVRLASKWPDPSFQGSPLPAERKVDSDGFSSHWQVSNYGRSFQRQWTDKTAVNAAGVSSSVFGVDIVPVLDSYRYVERSINYGVLVIVLLFTVFFLFEILSAVRIHPFQYALIGIALCMFYLGLLALSEVISFSAAYWIGAAAASLMIVLYSAKVLRSAGRAGIVAAGLVVVYAFLFVILRLQDYSLLIGTAGLFALLAILMYVTRNIDWYARDSGAQ
jgi:inner membrane protein